MTIIRVDPSLLKQSAGIMKGVASNTSSIGASLLAATQGLPSYDGQFGPQLIAIGREANTRLRGFGFRLDNLASRLEAKGNEFAMVDMANLTSIGNLSVCIDPLSTNSSLIPTDKDIKLEKEANRYLGLGHIISPLAKPTNYFSHLTTILMIGRTNFRNIFKISPPSFWPDLRFKFFKNIKSGTGAVLLDSTLEFISAEDYSLRGGGIALGVGAIGSLVSWKASLINAGVQIGGKISIESQAGLSKMMSVNPEHERIVDESADRADKVLDKIDLGNVIRSTSTLLTDSVVVKFETINRAYYDAVNDPTYKNINRLGLLLLENPTNPIIAGPVTMQDPIASAKIMEDTRALGNTLSDFAYGLNEIPYEITRYSIITGYVTGAGVVDRAKLAADDFSGYLNNINREYGKNSSW